MASSTSRDVSGTNSPLSPTDAPAFAVRHVPSTVRSVLLADSSTGVIRQSRLVLHVPAAARLPLVLRPECCPRVVWTRTRVHRPESMPISTHRHRRLGRALLAGSLTWLVLTRALDRQTRLHRGPDGLHNVCTVRRLWLRRPGHTALAGRALLG